MYYFILLHPLFHLQSIRFHPGLSNFIQIHPVSYYFIKIHLTSSDFILVYPEFIKFHLISPNFIIFHIEFIQFYSSSSDFLLRHLILSCFIRFHSSSNSPYFISDSCPAPSEASFTSGIGYGCHRGAQNCLNGNTPIDSLQEAWNRCGEVSGCTRIMKFTDNKFYLKEANDPVVSSAGSNSGTSGIEFYNTCASKPLSFTKIAQVILTKK